MEYHWNPGKDAAFKTSRAGYTKITTLMKTSSKITLIVAALLLFAGGFFWLTSRGPEPTPDTQITETLKNAEDAARRGSVGGVMSGVSDDFKSGAWNKTRLRLLLARTLRNGRGTDYNVHVNIPRIMPSPKGNANERLVTTQFSAFYSDNNENIFGSGPVVLVMRKETERKWVFFREPKWRIVSVVNMALVPGADAEGDGSGGLGGGLF